MKNHNKYIIKNAAKAPTDKRYLNGYITDDKDNIIKTVFSCDHAMILHSKFELDKALVNIKKRKDYDEMAIRIITIY